MEEATFEVRIKVRYDLNGESEDAVQDALEKGFSHAIERGALTGETAAEVEEYSFEVLGAEEGYSEGGPPYDAATATGMYDRDDG